MQEITIYELWSMLIGRKSVGTARSYTDALNRFQRDNGLEVSFEDITPEFIDQWKGKMREDLSKTTTNIYLRSFSAVAHCAFEYQLLKSPPSFLFRGLGIFSHNSSNSRKHFYLPVSDWQNMWHFYESKGQECPLFRSWRKDYRTMHLEALGLMLFMYLGNGMNLRDLCMLSYNRYYFQTGGKQFQFCRHKTAERTSNTVELPILYEMQVILDRLAQKPQEGGLVFSYLKSVIGDDWQENKLTALLGHSIRDRMKSVAKVLHLPFHPTPTWARHSFATNLIQEGVPKDYVSWAMGHTCGNTTNRYIASYKYEQMVEYNSLLLYPKGGCEHLIAQLKALPERDIEMVLQKIGRTQK